jgi:glycosyltransferase involved in cell wall biosynthesis
MSAKIAAVVCTYRRAELLERALASLAAQSLPSEDYEVVMVDNGADAATAAVLARFASRPPFRLVRQPVPGLSSARNAGVAATAAPLVAFLDDDAEAAPTWLACIARAFAEVRPRPGCVGGKIEPLFAVPRPAWFPDELMGFLSVVDWSPHARALEGGQWLAGTNIAFERALLLELGGFSPRLGRAPGDLLGMEEVVLQRRLRRRGLAIHYDPAIVVRHHIPGDRLTRRWLHGRAFSQGISDALADREERPSLPPWAVLAVKAALVAIQPWALAAAALPIAPRRRWTVRECHALARAGYVAAMLGADRPRARPP